MQPLFSPFVVLALILQIAPAYGCAATAPDCTIDKKQWDDLITSSLAGAFCKEDSPFLRCYEMDQVQCIKLTLQLTKQCIAENDKKIPRQIRKSESKEWGGTIGSCAGDRLTDIVHLKKGKSSDCATQKP
jgi:hypothetical protein